MEVLESVGAPSSAAQEQAFVGQESVSQFEQELSALIDTVEAIIRQKRSLAKPPVYGESSLRIAGLRKRLLSLKRSYSERECAGVVSQLTTLEEALSDAVDAFPSSPKKLLRALEVVAFIVRADLAAEIEAAGDVSQISGTPFIPYEILDDRRGVLKKILREANRCYEVECFNACATMIRRTVETLIIEAFERHAISDVIKVDGEYLEFSALIGKAAGEGKLSLTRTARKGLPEMKFLGDMGAHNRNALVRRDDLNRIRNEARLAIEELARISS